METALGDKAIEIDKSEARYDQLQQRYDRLQEQLVELAKGNTTKKPPNNG